MYNTPYALIAFSMWLWFSSCTTKTPCPEFGPQFLEYYPIQHGDEYVFENLENEEETTVVVHRMRVDHVSALKQSVVNGKNTCQCWSKISFGFEIPDEQLSYTLVMTKFEGSSIDAIDVSIDKGRRYWHEDYNTIETESIETLIAEHGNDLEDYLIFTSDNGAALVFEKAIGIVLIRMDDDQTWMIKSLPLKRKFNWDNMEFHEFSERC